MLRSTRSTRRNTHSAFEDATTWILNQQDRPELFVAYINEYIGKGVFTKEKIPKNTFLVEYAGDLITKEEGEIREINYEKEGCFLYFFEDNLQKYCIDATYYQNRIGRYVNDSPKGNCKVRKIHYNDRIHLCLYSTEEIPSGTELRYDYCAPNLWWRQQNKKTKMPYTVADLKDAEFPRKLTDISKYEVLDLNMSINLSHKIDEGMSAVVYKLLQPNRCAAVKCFKQKVMKKNLIIIAEQLCKLKHENIVQFLGYSVHPSAFLFEFCEVYLEGEKVNNLRQLLSIHNSNGNFVFDERLNYIQQATRGLIFLHENSIVHRDFKPSNLLVTNNNKQIQIKITDFDEMVILQQTITSTITLNSLKGMTLAYTAPELCSRAAKKPSKATDTYSLAISSYEIMSDLNSPWQDVLPLLNDGLLLQALKEDERPDISHVSNLYNLPECELVMDLISKAWSPKFEERPSTVEKASNVATTVHIKSEEDNIDFNCVESFKVVGGIMEITLEPDEKTHTNKPVEDFFTDDLQFLMSEDEDPALRSDLKNCIESFQNKDEDQNKDFILKDCAQVTSTPDQNKTNKGEDQNKDFILKDCLQVTSTPDQNKTKFCRKRKNKWRLKNFVLKNSKRKINNLSQVSLLNDSGFMIDTDVHVVDTDQSALSVSRTSLTSSIEHKSARTIVKKRRRKKPYRYCIFCKKKMSYLRRHIRSKHKHHPEVKVVLKLKKKEQFAAYEDFRRRGIFEYNMKEALNEKPEFERERRGRDQNDLVYCNNCKKFISRRFWYQHMKNCQANSCKKTVPVPINLLSLPENLRITDDFRDNILSKFQRDNIGDICRTDNTIIKVGTVFYHKDKRKCEKSFEVRKSVRTDMRRIAHMYNLFLKQNDIERPNGDASDMFNRRNFEHLKNVIDVYTTSEDNELKAGLKQNIYYLLKRVAKVLKGHYLVSSDDSAAEEIDRFISVLEMYEDFVFADATYQLNKNKNIKLRKPSELPLEEDMQLLKNHVMQRMKELLQDPFTIFDVSSYVELRDCACCRLTLLNARRGGEPARMLLDDFQQAINDAWIDRQRIDYLDPLDQLLVDTIKISYMTGKGNNHIVPVLIPPDTIDALKKLADPDIRSDVGILPDNNYLFASTRKSEGHTSGWHAVHNIIEKIDLKKPDNIKATSNRHRVSTLYAALHIPKSDRDWFYKHMGHSRAINEGTYQAPPALMEITKVGKQLLQIDAGNGASQRKFEGQSRVSTETSCDEASQRLFKGNEKKPSSEKTCVKQSGKNVLSRKSEKSYSMRSRSKVCKRKRYDHEDDDDYDDDDDDDYHPQNSVDLSCDKENELLPVRTNANMERSYLAWPESVHVKFLKMFEKYIRRESQNPMPSREEMNFFLEENSLDIPWQKVRTKINNERAKRDRIKKSNLEKILKTS
ncbi:uncharacterized protein LOC130629325 isoform X2 [Hydractinia symbiolongicarpus]|uniref:uncharacterized protein LOC130625016 isoform X2 n=1 Tax=Hydractinia symbiolongicarpus TaxID=13093 RepID=UPI00254FD4AB|nr:uncharacterized protein LOC130625016 isoform X2 [Hydractinia symbiolongicarpus]XP_057296372.1 uncharacterized protein LOC130625329 isoform X2 [Hydractinia symbiolongicarpus]XP_057298466.1 uncharacterized protein LOC130629325 isoform X2 [Hydractinia symbiolongicarpus]